MNELERQRSGKLYNPFKTPHPEYRKAHEELDAFNNTRGPQAREHLKNVFAYLGEGSFVVPPLYCDHGWKVSLGDNSFINTGCIILDEAPVNIGKNVQIAPRVSIFTAAHPIDADVRLTWLEYAKPVTICDDVWIGGGVIINPGVTIGRGAVIGSGSVVTKDVPEFVVAAGNPCRVIRPITDKDKQYWQEQLEDYRNDPDVQ